MGSKFSFVVDTDHYAGNFTPELCAYLTGEFAEVLYGERAPGYEEAQAFKEEVGDTAPEDFLELRYNYNESLNAEHCCEITNNPRWFSHGMGTHFRLDEEGVEKKALADYIQKVREYEEQIIERSPSNRERCQKRIAEAEALTKVPKFSANMSVALYLSQKPTPEQIQFLKSRAYKFVDYCKPRRRLPNNLVIEGFRLIEEVTTYKEEAL